jgi:hypothetical protein
MKINGNIHSHTLEALFQYTFKVLALLITKLASIVEKRPQYKFERVLQTVIMDVRKKL